MPCFLVDQEQGSIVLRDTKTKISSSCASPEVIRPDRTASSPRTGEIAISVNFTKSTGSFSPFFFCLCNLLRMVRLLHLELLSETLRTVSKPTAQLCSRFAERRDQYAL